MSAPVTYDQLASEISSKFPDLSPRLQQIAQFALRQPNDIALETIATLAERADVQPSALIRFAKAFGYEGFTDMQRVFRHRLVEHVPSYSERLRAMRAPADGDATPGALLARFAAAGIEALDHLRLETREDSLAQAIELLATVPAIHVLAQRRAFPVAAYLTYSFGQLGRPVHLLDGVGGMLRMQTNLVRPGDGLIAISYKEYSAEVVEMTAIAAEKGARVLAVTDSALSPLVSLAEVAVEVHETHVQEFRSLTASMCLALTLTVGLGARLQQPAAT